MKVTLLNYCDIRGGAARAVYRLHRALLSSDISSQLRVRSKASDDWTVENPEGSLAKMANFLRPRLGLFAQSLQITENTNFHSINWLPSCWSRSINRSSAEVINLHWVAGETLSIEDIGRIHKPQVWTAHDMWHFCGAEHYTRDDATARWRTGYKKENRPPFYRGLDLDRWVWQRKSRSWRRPVPIVAPSHWLANCFRDSAMFQDWPISVIPNVLDTRLYQPLDRDFCRQVFGLPLDKKIILFGASGARSDRRKGYDLLLEGLTRLAERIDPSEVQCVIFGESQPGDAMELPFETRWMGHVNDDATLVLLYNAADVMIVPSRQEAFGQTASEALACGCPVVAFATTGLLDVVEHKETGYLASAYELDELAEGIYWVLEDSGRRMKLGIAARERAVRLWSPQVVIPQYIQVYKQAIDCFQ